MKIQPRLYNLHYNDSLNCITGVDYQKPVKLKKALIDIIHEQNLNEGVVGEKTTIQRFLKDLEKAGAKILNRKVISLSGYGSVAAAFETADGKIIKLTDGNHFPMNRPRQMFDVPIFKHGKNGKTHYYLEEKLLQYNMPVYWVDSVKDMIKSSGFRSYDLYSFDTHQIGIAKNGRVYLADPECAKYKTIFHALFDKAVRFAKLRK